jgi:aromatase
MAGHTDNSIVIDAPMDAVWTITNDVSGWPQLFSEYSAADIIEQRGNAVRFRLALHPDENGKVWSWVSERTPDEATHTVRSQRVETGVFKYMSLFWEYTQTDAGVRMRWVQDFEMKPGAPLDDAGMTKRLNTNTVLQLALIKDKVEAAVRSAAVAG